MQHPRREGLHLFAVQHGQLSAGDVVLRAGGGGHDRSDGPSLKEIFFEIDRLQESPTTKEELRAVQNYMAGTFVLQNSSRSGIINQLAFLDLHGLGEDYLRDYVPRVNALTPGDVQRMAQKYVRDQQMTIVIVGDPKAIRAQVERFGDIR